jgi:hypothetical protein
MSSMEPDIKDFLKRVVWSISLGLVYLILNSSIGIAGNWLFFDERPTMGNYIFYAWLLASTAGLIWVLNKWWKKKFPHG